jgi:hypothetical protein
LPKIPNFERNLHNVNIRQKDFDATMKLKLPQEPFYNTYSRIVNMVTEDQLLTDYKVKTLQESMEAWKKRALEAEAKLNNVQRTLI